MISGFIGLAYEGISSFLQYKREKALQQTMHTMNKRTSIEQNRVFHLEDSMIMYGVYNVDTLEKLIQMVHKMNAKLVWFERLYAGHVNKWFEMYSSSQGANHYAIHSLLYLKKLKKKTLKCMKICKPIKRILVSNKSIIKRIFTNIAFATF